VIASFNRDGNAIGGLSVGDPAEEMYEMTEVVTNILPQEKTRYLMGVGTRINILENVAMGNGRYGWVMETRNHSNGMPFTQNGIINIKNEKWKDDFSPIEAESDLLVDQIHTKAYLRHLICSQEILGAQIASLHNLHFYLWLVKQAREKI